MKNKSKNFSDNYYTAILFLALILIVIFLSSNLRNGKEVACKPILKDLKSTDNYTYTAVVNDNQLEFKVKKYDKKYLIEVNKDEQINRFFLHYTDFLIENENGLYKKYNGENIIQEIDNKYLILDYINDLTYNEKGKVKKGNYCYDITREGLNICITGDNIIEINKDGTKIVYTILDTKNNKDFETDINLEKSTSSIV